MNILFIYFYFLIIISNKKNNIKMCLFECCKIFMKGGLKGNVLNIFNLI